jgi:sporulation protein YlmC with PRC-barrel domain
MRTAALDVFRPKEEIHMTQIKQTDPGRKLRRILSASTISGDKVVNPAGEKLGEIKELMIDLPSGRIAYAVLSFGGFLGMGETLFAVPWNALTVDEDQKQIVLNADKEQLKNAPGFDKDNWPDMVNVGWGTQIHTYYGTQPYWESEVQEKTLRGGGGL